MVLNVSLSARRRGEGREGGWLQVAAISFAGCISACDIECDGSPRAHVPCVGRERAHRARGQHDAILRQLTQQFEPWRSRPVGSDDDGGGGRGGAELVCNGDE
eukprot:scaffold126812_cov27-Tisochrysis_lutea.AAC.2